MDTRISAARERLKANYGRTVKPQTRTERANSYSIQVNRELKKCPVSVKGYDRPTVYQGMKHVKGYCRQKPGPPTHWKGKRLQVVTAVKR